MPTQFFRDLERTSYEKQWIAKTIQYNKRTSRGITVPDFKLYYRTIVIKTGRQVNGIEDPDVDPHASGHLTFDKEASKFLIINSEVACGGEHL